MKTLKLLRLALTKEALLLNPQHPRLFTNFCHNIFCQNQHFDFDFDFDILFKTETLHKILFERFFCWGLNCCGQVASEPVAFKAWTQQAESFL